MLPAVRHFVSHLLWVFAIIWGTRIVLQFPAVFYEKAVRLPPNKEYIKPCQREALFLHPGMIEEVRILHRHGDFWVQLDLQGHDDVEWFVLCDLATGKIIREQKLVDDAL